VITSSAVRAHIAAIVRKLRVPDRAAAVELFRQRLASIHRSLFGFIGVSAGQGPDWRC